MAVGQLLSASHYRWKLKLRCPGLRPFDGVSLAGDGGVKRSDAVNSHSNPDVLMERVQLSFTFRKELPFAEFCQTRWLTAANRWRSRRGPRRHRGEWGQAFSVCFIMLDSSLRNAYKVAAKPSEFATGVCVCRDVGNTKTRLYTFCLKKMDILKDFHVTTANSTYLQVAQTVGAGIQLCFIGFGWRHPTFILKTCRYSWFLPTSMNSHLRTLWRLLYSNINQTFSLTQNRS